MLRHSARLLCTQSTQHRDLLYRASLPHVCAGLGWSTQALAAGAKDLGWSPAAIGVFPRGAVELVEDFVAENREKLRAALDAGASKECVAVQRG